MVAEKKDSGTSYTTQSLKKALAAAKVRKAMEEFQEIAKMFQGNTEASEAFTGAQRELEELLRLLDEPDQ